MKTNIKEVYVRIFGEDIFPHIEKAIDENGNTDFYQED